MLVLLMKMLPPFPAERWTTHFENKQVCLLHICAVFYFFLCVTNVKNNGISFPKQPDFLWSIPN